VRRLICWFIGHADTVWLWGPWRNDPEYGRHRVITEECTRCRDVFSLRSEVEGEPWTP